MTILKKMAERFDRQAARAEKMSVLERKARDQRLLDVLRQSPEVRDILERRRAELLPVRQAAVAAMQAAPQRRAPEIKRASDVRIAAEQRVEALEADLRVARLALGEARQRDYGAGLDLTSDLAHARRELERTADPRIGETRRWIEALDEIARNAIEARPTTFANDPGAGTRLESNMPQVQAVRAELQKLIERCVGLTYEAELPQGELERLHVAGLSAMKPMKLVNALPTLDLTGDDLLLLPDAVAA